MKLQPISLSCDPVFWRKPPDNEDSSISGVAPLCAFCGGVSTSWRIDGATLTGGERSAAAVACPLCALPHHLERPRIDEEAVLVWLPEISQAALNTVMRGIQVGLHALGEDVRADAVFRQRVPEIERLYVVRAILAERSQTAAKRLGTTSPRELGLALLELSPAASARRTDLLGGIRLMSLGRFFQQDDDVYPEIVAFWAQSAKIPSPLSERAA